MMAFFSCSSSYLVRFIVLGSSLALSNSLVKDTKSKSFISLVLSNFKSNLEVSLSSSLVFKIYNNTTTKINKVITAVKKTISTKFKYLRNLLNH